MSLLGGGIYQTAKYVVANHKRKIMKKSQVEQTLVEEIHSSCEEDAYNALMLLEDEEIEEEQYIPQVMASISKEKQQLYRMYYVEGKSHKQIATTLGISEVSLRMKYVRLRREIKRIVSEIAKENFI